MYEAHQETGSSLISGGEHPERRKRQSGTRKVGFPGSGRTCHTRFVWLAAGSSALAVIGVSESGNASIICLQYYIRMLQYKGGAAAELEGNSNLWELLVWHTRSVEANSQPQSKPSVLKAQSKQVHNHRARRYTAYSSLKIQKLGRKGVLHVAEGRVRGQGELRLRSWVSGTQLAASAL
ncbi:hypothetical protein BKA62DRAFT_675846 [Auriculariales sp. MPI-PUGE-AT-0066]|nr:hypothetical protein BKA62DRAFT_675846 [Auriculariales sp. MPI-PUGE-AT-0066]